MHYKCCECNVFVSISSYGMGMRSLRKSYCMEVAQSTVPDITVKRGRLFNLIYSDNKTWNNGISTALARSVSLWRRSANLPIRRRMRRVIFALHSKSAVWTESPWEGEVSRLCAVVSRWGRAGVKLGREGSCFIQWTSWTKEGIYCEYHVDE